MGARTTLNGIYFGVFLLGAIIFWSFAQSWTAIVLTLIPGRHVLITTRTIVDETEDLPVRLDDERCASRVC